jgi:NTE family protein
VCIGGRDLVDGGVVSNTPLSHAVALGANTIWVLPTGYACALPEAPGGVLAMVLQALSLTINQRLSVEVTYYEGSVDLRVVPPLCPIQVSPTDFSQTADLIERSYEATSGWLRSAPRRAGQAQLLEPHAH